MESCRPEEAPDLDDQLRIVLGGVGRACFHWSYGLNADWSSARLLAAKLSGSDGKVCREAESLLASETGCEILRSMEWQRTFKVSKPGSKARLALSGLL
jgi:hypothetical protein